MAGSDAVSSELSGAACLCTQGRTQSILDTDSLYKWHALLLILEPSCRDPCLRVFLLETAAGAGSACHALAQLYQTPMLTSCIWVCIPSRVFTRMASQATTHPDFKLGKLSKLVCRAFGGGALTRTWQSGWWRSPAQPTRPTVTCLWRATPGTACGAAGASQHPAAAHCPQSHRTHARPLLTSSCASKHLT